MGHAEWTKTKGPARHFGDGLPNSLQEFGFAAMFECGIKLPVTEINHPGHGKTRAFGNGSQRIPVA
jgi:hypothetical protein